MKKLIFCFFIFPLHFSLLAQGYADLGYIPVEQLFTNLNYVDLENNKLVEDAVVAIENDKVIYVGDPKLYGLPFKSKNSKDCKGQYVMFGLHSMHAHFPLENIEQFFVLNLLNGVTNMRSMRGKDEHLDLRKNPKILKPNLFLAAPATSRADSLSYEDIQKKVKSYIQKGYDLVKISSVKDFETYKAWAAAVQEESAQLHFGGHIPRNVGVFNTIHAGQRTIEHLGGYFRAMRSSEEDLEKAIKLTVENEVYVCATLDWTYRAYHGGEWEDYIQRKGMEWVADTVKEKWQEDFQAFESQVDTEKKEFYKAYYGHELKIVKRLYDAGTKLLIGQDSEGGPAVAGYTFLEELKHHEKAGIPINALLKAATLNAMEYQNVRDQEKFQNLVFLNKNPLKDLAALQSVEGVVLNGKWHSRAQLLKQLKLIK